MTAQQGLWELLSLVGGGGGGSFEAVTKEKSLLAGFVVTTIGFAGNPVIRSLQPIFWTPQGKAAGPVFGTPNGREIRIEAKSVRKK